MKKILLISLTVLFMFGMVGTANAVPMLNTSYDTFEDFVSGEKYDEYQNSGMFMYYMTGNNMGIKYNDGSLEFEIESWLLLHGIISNRDVFALTDNSTEVLLTGWKNNGLIDLDEAYWNSPGAPEVKSGTWTVTPQGNTIDLYAVKGADGYAMYLTNDIDGLGSWSTYDLWINGHNGTGLALSHFTGYNSTSVSAPEPATMLLLGSGLVGFLGYRKKFKK